MGAAALLLTPHSASRVYFKNRPTFWMNLQTRYDLEIAEDEIAAKVDRDVQPLETVAARR